MKKHKININIDFAFVMVVIMQLTLIIGLASAIISGNITVSNYVVRTITAIIGWVLCEVFRQKYQNKNEI